MLDSRLSQLRQVSAPPKRPPPPPLRPAPPVAPQRRPAPVPPARTQSATVTVEREIKPTQFVELQPLEHASTVLSPIEDLERKAMELLSSGASEPLVAVQCGVSLSRIFELRRGQTTMSIVNRQTIGLPSVQNANSNVASADSLPSPKEVFSRRMRDFDECLEIAVQEYKNDPASETNHAAMNGFMKTMKELYESYQDLDDPQEVAEKIVKQLVYPFMSGVIKLNIDAFRTMIEDMSPTMVSEFQRDQFREGLKDSARKIEEKVRGEFNRAIKTLEVVYQANLSSLYLRPQASTAATELDATTEQKKAAA